jgi:hypothetical protein
MDNSLGKEINEPVKILKKFINERYEFNEKGKKLDDDKYDPELNKKLLEELKEIFEKYCTKKERKYSNCLVLSTPSEYNLETNEILSCKIEDKKSYIEVQETVGFKNKFRYTLNLTKDGWRIYKREMYDDVFKNAWEKSIL